MTTQNDQPATTETAAGSDGGDSSTARHAWPDDVEPPASPGEVPASETPPSANQAEAPAAETAAPAGQADVPPEQPTTSTATPDASADESFFPETALAGFRSRWDEVQFSFVDDPRQSVEKADALLSEVFDELTAGFATVRAKLSAALVEGASTEDLRQAVKRHREYFRRLISI